MFIDYKTIRPIHSFLPVDLSQNKNITSLWSKIRDYDNFIVIDKRRYFFPDLRMVWKYFISTKLSSHLKRQRKRNNHDKTTLLEGSIRINDKEIILFLKSLGLY